MTTLKVLPMVSRHRRHSCSWRLAIFPNARKSSNCGPHFSPIVIAIRWQWWRCIGRWFGWLSCEWPTNQPVPGWSARSGSSKRTGTATIIALAVPLERADVYGDMLTVDIGHLDYWAGLARRGTRALREAGLPTAPIWSEYEEWPRGRVLYDSKARHFVIRADRQLHQPAFVRLIAEHFRVDVAMTTVMPDDHYHCVRRVPVPGTA